MTTQHDAAEVYTALQERHGNPPQFSPVVDDDDAQLAYLRQWAAEHPAAVVPLREGWRWGLLVLTIACIIAAWATWAWAVA